MTCLDTTLRRMARLGLINCTLSPCRMSFHAFGHQCERFAQAPDTVVAARRRWVETNGATA